MVILLSLKKRIFNIVKTLLQRSNLKLKKLSSRILKRTNGSPHPRKLINFLKKFKKYYNYKNLKYNKSHNDLVYHVHREIVELTLPILPTKTG